VSPRREASRFMEPGPRRDSEDGPTVHLSGGTARRAMTPHCPCPVGSLRHRRRTRSRRTERRGSHPMPEPTPPSAADDRRPQGGPPPPLGPLGSGLGPPGAGAPRAGDQVVPPRPAARLDGNGPRFPGSTSYPSAPTGPDSRPPSSPGPGRSSPRWAGQNRRPGAGAGHGSVAPPFTQGRTSSPWGHSSARPPRGATIPGLRWSADLPPVHTAMICVALPGLAISTEGGQLTGSGLEGGPTRALPV
jgi:hypothetical protein